MLFQGQEFVESRSFSDTVPLDWNRCERHRGIVHLYRDLIALRLNRAGVTRGLCGQHVNVHHVNEGGRVLAYHRWEWGGARDDVIVVANFSHRGYHNYVVGLCRAAGGGGCASTATGRGTAACSVKLSAATATPCRDDMTRCRSTARSPSGRIPCSSSLRTADGPAPEPKIVYGMEKGTSQISPICQGKEPRGTCT